MNEELAERWDAQQIRFTRAQIARHPDARFPYRALLPLLDALEAARGVAPARDETAWLIERGQSMGRTPTVWWAGRDRWSLAYSDQWTTDAFRAWRFATREEAQAQIDRYGTDGACFGVAVEHGFAAPSPERAGRSA